MKKASIVVLLLLVACFCSGCWDKKEFNQMSFAGVVAIDWIDQQYTVTTQIMLPKSGEQGGSDSQVMLLEGRGDSVAEAISDMELRAPREIYWGHLGVVILGEQVLENGVEKAIDYFMRNNQVRRSTLFVAAQGEGREIVQGSMDMAQQSVFYLKSLIEDQEKRIKDSSVNLNDLIITVAEQGIDLYIPQVRMVSNEQNMQGASEEESKQGSSGTIKTVPLELSGGAVLQDGKLVGWVEQRWSSGYYYICCTVKQSSITFDLPNGNSKIALAVQGSHAKYTIEQTNPLKIKITIEPTLNLLEFTGEPQDIKNRMPAKGAREKKEQMIKNIIAGANDTIKQQAEQSIAQAQQWNVDPYGVGRWLYAFHPKLAQQYGWEDGIAQFDIVIEVDSQLKLSASVD